MPPTAARPPKVQRWIDVIAALLLYRYPITFEQLAAGVPAYSDPTQKSDARMRMFERDKDELRELGVPIETVPDENGAMNRYLLKSRNFYLPYLYVKEPGAPAPSVKRPTGPGYQSLPSLAFEPDELAMIARAGARVQQLGHPGLAASAATALRKLAFDMPIPDGGVREIMIPPTDAPDHAVLEALDQAVRKHKRVEFEYWSIERNARGRRTVEPYGLVFKSGHWYLIARDPGSAKPDAIRHFRVSRVTAPVVNGKQAQRADFTVPPAFDLWSYTAAPHAWELGDGDAVPVTVRFDMTDRHAIVASELREADPDYAGCRRFTVRRSAAFARWLLSFAGAARPVHPPAMIEEFQALARATAALYANDAPDGADAEAEEQRA